MPRAARPTIRVEYDVPEDMKLRIEKAGLPFEPNQLIAAVREVMQTVERVNGIRGSGEFGDAILNRYRGRLELEKG